MKNNQYSFLVLMILLGFHITTANNIKVNNVSLTGQNTTAGVNSNENFTMIQFDLNWENSWRTNVAPNNWDAAWVFVKYRAGNGDWHHAYLNDSSHIAPAGTIINAGLLYPDSSFEALNNPCLGVFIYRDSVGNGPFQSNGIKLKWNYGANGLSDNDNVEIGVFAVEMVYVPEGSFYLGDRTTYGTIYTAPNINSPYFIDSEDTSIVVGNAAGNLTYSGGTSYGDQSGPIPAAFPKGYSAFYCMKYEISQGQYVDFLNTLTATQQASRVAISPQSPAGTQALANDTGFFSNRNGIQIQTPASGNSPAVFACNLNFNTTLNQSDDGKWVACNFLGRPDLSAYLDWSGLRPMTELEFEKACRGPLISVTGEFVWGTTSNVATTGFLISSRTQSEISSNPNANHLVSTFNGPIRVGCFADATSNRVQSGASYYGIMEMASNVWESTVSIGNSSGRSFTGEHGNGILDNTGNADVNLWDSAFGIPAGIRGGGWGNILSDFRISSRFTATSNGYGRNFDSGGRGIRTAP